MSQLIEPFPGVVVDGLTRRMHFQTGWSDFGGDRGVSDVKLHLAVVGEHGAVSVEFRTNWHPAATYDGWRGRGVGPWRHDGIDVGMDLGLRADIMLLHFFFNHTDDEDASGSGDCLYSLDPRGGCGWEDVHGIMERDDRHREFCDLFIAEGPDAAFKALGKLYHERIEKAWHDLQRYDGCHT